VLWLAVNAMYDLEQGAVLLSKLSAGETVVEVWSSAGFVFLFMLHRAGTRCTCCCLHTTYICVCSRSRCLCDVTSACCQAAFGALSDKDGMAQSLSDASSKHSE
jgi:hypothetical protein